MDKDGGYRTTVLALRLMALTYVRTVELRKAHWCEFDPDNAIWIIPAERMKMRQPHIVPLSKQAVTALKELRKLTGGGEVLFPSYRKPGQVMSATTLNKALERMGYLGRFSGHGFRSTATTLLGLLSYPENRVDLQLAHSKRKPASATVLATLSVVPESVFCAGPKLVGKLRVPPLPLFAEGFASFGSTQRVLLVPRAAPPWVPPKPLPSPSSRPSPTGRSA